MSIVAEKIYRKPARSPVLADLNVVVLMAPARTDDGDVMPSGARGTIVGSFSDGASYTVEFADPEGALATVPAEHLAKAPA